MAKGKTNQPLVIWVAAEYEKRPEIVALANRGHYIVGMLALGWRDADIPEPDLILHPAAHQWNDELWDYLDMALKAARARRKKK